MKETLLVAKEEFPYHSTHSSIWMFTEQLLNFERSLLRGDWQDAEVAVTNLEIFDSLESRIRYNPPICRMKFLTPNYQKTL